MGKLGRPRAALSLTCVWARSGPKGALGYASTYAGARPHMLGATHAVHTPPLGITP